MNVNKLLKLRCKNKIIGKLIEKLIRNQGCFLPRNVKIGKNVQFSHNGFGTVVHPNTIIEDNVRIYQNVTIGRADIWNSIENSEMEGIIISEGAIICAGAKILCKRGKLVIGRNSIVCANAVVTKSIGDNEIWAGIPAKKIKNRNDTCSN